MLSILGDFPVALEETSSILLSQGLLKLYGCFSSLFIWGISFYIVLFWTHQFSELQLWPLGLWKYFYRAHFSDAITLRSLSCTCLLEWTSWWSLWVSAPGSKAQTPLPHSSSLLRRSGGVSACCQMCHGDQSEGLLQRVSRDKPWRHERDFGPTRNPCRGLSITICTTRVFR